MGDVNENAVNTANVESSSMENIVFADTPAKTDAESVKVGVNTQTEETNRGDWKSVYPEKFRETLGSFQTEEDALNAFKRGAGYKPAQKPDEVDLGLPADMELDSTVLSNFQEFCVQEGLTPTQAKALASWQMSANETLHKHQIEKGMTTLRGTWGAAMQENSHRALTFVSKLNEKMGGRLTSGSGLALMNSPEAIEAFYHVSTMVSEDSIGSIGTGRAEKKMSKVDYYKSLGFN